MKVDEGVGVIRMVWCVKTVHDQSSRSMKDERLISYVCVICLASSQSLKASFPTSPKAGPQDRLGWSHPAGSRERSSLLDHNRGVETRESC